MRSFVTFLIVGWAGFMVMALELLCGRYLPAYFGGTLNVWGALICVFLLALSLGYLTGGNLSRLSPNVRMLGVFLFAAAAFLIPAYAQAETILGWVFTRILHPGYGAMVATMGLFGGAAYLLGMVTPYAMRLLVRNEAESGSTAGWLYFTGTIGSAAGTIFTSFYAVMWFTREQMLLGIMAISVVIGLLTFFIAHSDDGQ
jgi:MFS family permease